MSSDPTWKRDANGVEHPTRETLLAFIREQCSEQERSRVNEHLLAGCVPCNRLHVSLIQASSPLNHLKHMSRYLYYPELQSNQVLLHMQRGEPLTSVWTGKRKRKFQIQGRPVRRSQATGRYSHRTGLRVFRLSFPVAFGLLLIFMTVAIVLAYTIASFVNLPFILPGQSNNIYLDPGPNTPVVAPHELTPTITVPVTITPTSPVSATVGVSPTPTVTVTVVKGPTIDYCLPPGLPHGYNGPLIFICGYGFKVGDKVSLLLDYYGRNAPVKSGSYKVDKLGGFTGFLYFDSCENLPIGVYARDETLRPASVSSNILTNIPVAGCHGLTPTPTHR